MLEAMTWVARAALAEGNLQKAESNAGEVRRLAGKLAKIEPLDADRHLPLALGAAIEVQAQVMTRSGRRADAIQFLRKELDTWHATSIRARVQKNINLISLEGKPAPRLEISQWLGPKPPPLESLRGHPVLLFFWAHWCGDCKRQVADIARLIAEFGSQNLKVIGPTQRYGYVAGGEEAPPDRELQYIDAVRQKFYAALPQMPVPVSEENFNVYGASSTPTLVLLDAKGLVRMTTPVQCPITSLPLRCTLPSSRNRPGVQLKFRPSSAEASATAWVGSVRTFRATL